MTSPKHPGADYMHHSDIDWHAREFVRLATNGKVSRHFQPNLDAFEEGHVWQDFCAKHPRQRELVHQCMWTLLRGMSDACSRMPREASRDVWIIQQWWQPVCGEMQSTLHSALPTKEIALAELERLEECEAAWQKDHPDTRKKYEYTMNEMEVERPTTYVFYVTRAGESSTGHQRIEVVALDKQGAERALPEWVDTFEMVAE